MTFNQAVSTCLTKYVVFRGRAPRSEYWWFIVFLALSSFGLSRLDARLFPMPVSLPDANGFVDPASGPLATIFFWATLLPMTTVTVRRLHDVNWSAWWFFGLCIAPVLVLIGLASLVPQTGQEAVAVSKTAGVISYSYEYEGGVLTLYILAFWMAGLLAVTIASFFRGTDGPNRFGPDPLAQPAPESGQAGTAASDAHLGIDS